MWVQTRANIEDSTQKPMPKNSTQGKAVEGE